MFPDISEDGDADQQHPGTRRLSLSLALFPSPAPFHPSRRGQRQRHRGPRLVPHPVESRPRDMGQLPPTHGGDRIFRSPPCHVFFTVDQICGAKLNPEADRLLDRCAPVDHQVVSVLLPSLGEGTGAQDGVRDLPQGPVGAVAGPVQ